MYNPHLFTIDKLADKLLFSCKRVPKEIFDKLLREKIQDKDVAVLSFYSSIASNSRNVPIKNDYTVNVLRLDLWIYVKFISRKYKRCEK